MSSSILLSESKDQYGTLQSRDFFSPETGVHQTVNWRYGEGYEYIHVWKKEFLHKNGNEIHYFYRNGQIWDKTFYRKGRAKGERRVWHENGRIMDRTFNQNGYRNGEDRRWDGNGTPIFYVYCIDGNARQFSLSNKYSFLKLKRSYFRFIIPEINSFLISDLSKIIHRFS